MAEAVGDGGLIVPARDARAFADACTTLLLNDALRGRLAAAGRRRALEMFTIDRLVNDFRTLYDDVARRHPRSAVPAPRSPLRLAYSSEAR
jgi:glycosyltransferase involved in cell wall biosynthesis